MTSAEAPRRPRASEHLARRLAAVLLDADMPEGTPLMAEDDLVRNIGCSRTALRGALRLLENWGLVTMQLGRNGGPVTRRPVAGDLRMGLAALMHSREATMADLMAARRAIVPMLAAEAARRRTDDQVEDLRRTTEAEQLGVGSRAKHLATANQFSRQMAAAAGLPTLALFLEGVSTISDETIRRIVPSDEPRRASVVRAHERAVDAIERHDDATAESVMLAYAYEAEVFWRQFAPHMMDAPLRPLAFVEP